MSTVLSSKSRDCSTESIAKYQQSLKQNHFIYLETEDPNFEWIKFAKLVTDKELMLQYGQEIFHVKWEPELLNFSDARGKKPVLPHTEASDCPKPPEYMALWCQQPATCGGGMTTLASVEGFLKTLTPGQKKQLVETEHYFGATGGVHASRTDGVTHPILSFTEDNKPILRFSYNYSNTVITVPIPITSSLLILVNFCQKFLINS